MPGPKRPRVQPTEDWHQLQLQFQWPEQRAYELIRPVVLFGQTAGERAQETQEPPRSIQRKADRFERYGMASLLSTGPAAPTAADRRALPPHVRQLIVDLRVEYPPVRVNELATICWVATGRRPSTQTVKRVLADGPPPSRRTRRYPPYHQIPDPEEARLAVVRLHVEGWNSKSIAGYLQTSRTTVHTILRRWIEEGRGGLPDKPPVPKHPARRVDMRAIETVRRLQQNPELGEFRIHAALKQLGIQLSPRTCGRILALNRRLYGIPGPSHEPKEPKHMPFAAQRRHQYWTVDLRYIDVHQLGGGNIYCISILENYSRAILASGLSRSQDLTAYLMVLFAAVRQHGCPEVLVSDSGGIFRAK